MRVQIGPVRVESNAVPLDGGGLQPPARTAGPYERTGKTKKPLRISPERLWCHIMQERIQDGQIPFSGRGPRYQEELLYEYDAKTNMGIASFGLIF